MTFLPKDYEVPTTTGNYFKFEKGANKFRVLSSAIIGYEYWNLEGKPVRLKEYPQVMPKDIRAEEDGTFKINHFWAFVVYSYSHSRVQVMEVTQKTIMREIKALVSNEDWGDPKGFDITVTKEGEKFETKYTVQPSPHKELADDIKEIAKNADTVKLDALFDGSDPFATEKKDEIEYPEAEDINPDDIPI